MAATPNPDLVEAVQTNCDIADATHAADMALCTYLLQMREFYRWEQGRAPLQPLNQGEVGNWIAAREVLWAGLQGRSWRFLPLGDESFDPFDVAVINERLNPQGLVYGAGYTAPGRASFFLGELESVQVRDGVMLRVCGPEYARGLVAPPAALQGGVIHLRRQILQQWLWEKYEAWTLRRRDGAFRRALLAHGYGQMNEQAIERMARQQAETVLLHELGEFQVGQQLGPDWAALRQSLTDRRTELTLRAVRDLWADCRVTLPTLLQRGDAAALHFWFANFDGIRAERAPALAQAYEAWCAGASDRVLRVAVSQGVTHWRAVCEQALAQYRCPGNETAVRLRDWLVADATRQV